jgi:hypothetical protein
MGHSDLIRLAADIRSQAAISARSGQLEALEAIADQVEAVAYQLGTRIAEMESQRNVARNWARLGYEIGQGRESWSDYSATLPTWLTTEER